MKNEPEKGILYHSVCNLLQCQSFCGIPFRMSDGWGGRDDVITVFNLAKHTV